MARHIDFSKHSRPVRLAAHAVGLDHKRPYIRHGKTFYRPYRNYYTVPKDVPEYTTWIGLCECGYAKGKLGRSGEIFTFWLTRSGLDWLGGCLGITIYDEED